MRFDWYQATFAEKSPNGLLDDLQAAYGPGARVDPFAPLYGYGEGYAVVQGDLVRARVLADGHGVHEIRKKHVHAWATSDDTDAFVDCVRNEWPGKHLVTRMDPENDFDEPGVFERLLAVCLARGFADDVKLYRNGDWDRLIDGRTLYMGAPSSDVRARLYEKGKQLRSQVDTSGKLLSLDWTRLEIQIRPQGDARLAAASMTPEEAWGCSQWTHSLLKDVTGIEVPRVRMRVWRKSDDQRAFEWMCKQYGRMLERLVPDLGDWLAVGLQIGSEIERQARLQRHGRA